MKKSILFTLLILSVLLAACSGGTNTATIEKANGKSYEENLKERIFGPLGLEQTYLQTGQPEPGALPQAYYHSPFTYTTSEWNASQG